MIPRAHEFAGDALLLLDQRRLPAKVTWLRYTTAADVAAAIADLVVRGAPAIGVAAAYGLALAGRSGDREEVRQAADRLVAARPTAINLKWAVKRLLARAGAVSDDQLAATLRQEAEAIHAEDARMCRRIGEHGQQLLGERPRILTYCNAGALATGGIGTALAPVYVAAEAGRQPQVYACETRPVMQGARLTSWELTQAGIPVTLLVDGAAAFLLARGEVDAIFVGADRIAANGDVANKIGTYALACASARHDVPFYVAAPQSTFDPHTPAGADIPIEFRPPEELSDRFAEPVSPTGISCWTPAFDVTPRALVTAYVSDSGVEPGGRGQIT
jgi:methylthioribose-1-phosphate isomerase